MVDALLQLYPPTGVPLLTWQMGVMLGGGFTLLSLGVSKSFEPLGLIPIAFGLATAGGVLMAKFMNLFSKHNRINPLIGAAVAAGYYRATPLHQGPARVVSPNSFLEPPAVRRRRDLI
jgi:oxaloacetate decarboxylase beta subunit